jgi:hypothetical protein
MTTWKRHGSETCPPYDPSMSKKTTRETLIRINSLWTENRRSNLSNTKGFSTLQGVYDTSSLKDDDRTY